MHHSTEDHVIESIDPKWSEDKKDESRLRNLLIEGRFNAIDPCRARNKLPDRTHYQYPAEPFFMVPCLKEMTKDAEAEEGCE